MKGTEKPLFILRGFPQKNNDFAVLACDGVNLELVEWRHPALGHLARFQRNQR